MCRRRAAAGEPDAQFELGHAYLNGWGVPENHLEATAWYRRAAEQGYSDAQFALALAYTNGWGVPQSDQDAATWYRAAAEQGDLAAQECLGWMYHMGLGVPKDPVQGLMWMDLAAEGYPTHNLNPNIAASRYAAIVKSNAIAAEMTMEQIEEALRRADERRSRLARS
jgi:TPR repeat protein